MTKLLGKKLGYVKPIGVTDLCVYCSLYFKVIRVYLLYLFLKVFCESRLHDSSHKLKHPITHS